MHLSEAQLAVHTHEFERGERMHEDRQAALDIEREDFLRSGCGVYQAPPASVMFARLFDQAIQRRDVDHRFEFTYLGNWKNGVQRDKTMFDVFINAMENDAIAMKVIRGLIHCAAKGNVEAIEACDAVRVAFVTEQTTPQRST